MWREQPNILDTSPSWSRPTPSQRPSQPLPWLPGLLVLLTACAAEPPAPSAELGAGAPSVAEVQKPPPPPLDPSSPLARARALRATGELEQACQLLKPEIEKSPEDLELNRDYQDLLRALKKVEEGRIWYGQKVQEAPASPARQYLYGRAIIVENPVEAEAAFKRALEKDATFEWAWLALATTYTLRGDNFAAVQLYEKALKRFPSSAVLHFNLADAQVNIGALRQAREHAEASIRLDSTSSRGWELLGLIHLKQGDKKSARESLEKALTLNPTAGLGNLVMAELELKDERLTEARAHAVQAVKSGKRLTPDLAAKFPEVTPAGSPAQNPSAAPAGAAQAAPAAPTSPSKSDASPR